MTQTKQNKLRVSRNANVTFKRRICGKTIGILVAIVLSFLYILIAIRKNPFEAVEIIFNGCFGGEASLNSILKELILLLLIALALIPAYKMKFWNVGAQGQILIGALTTAIIMIYLSELPNYLVILFSIILSIIAGGLWGLIPAIFKAKFKTNETLFTLMMNYIAIQLVSFSTEKWRGQKSSMGNINQKSEIGYLPNILDNKNYLPLLITIIILLALIIYINKSKHGYEIKLVGESENTAKYAGVNVPWVIMRTMFLSGAICGLVGFIYVSGFDHTISTTTSGGYGFTAIIVCWLSQFNPLIMPLMAFTIVFLNKGAKYLSAKSFTNSYGCEFIVFLVILCIMASEFFINYNISFTKKQKKDSNHSEPNSLDNKQGNLDSDISTNNQDEVIIETFSQEEISTTNDIESNNSTDVKESNGGEDNE